ncbi:M28 family metallopeptidase [soil metagenome]
MRSALFSLLTASSASAGTYVTIGTDALPAAFTVARHEHAAFQIVAAHDGIAVLDVPADQLAPLSDTMHTQFHRCGGFMVHRSLADALAAPVPEQKISYTVDRESVVRAVLPTLDERTLAGTIRELSAMPNRFYKSAAGAEASNWLAERWRSLATRAGVTVQLVDHGYPQNSVVMTIPGTRRANEVIVIGGHLDSIAMGGLSANAPGADDDASGIATLTEIARGLLAADYRPERTVVFVAYEAEEIGLLGSQAIVRDFKRANMNVVGALQLDMTNFKGSDKDIWLMKDFTSAGQNAFLGTLIDTYVGGATWGYDACGYACSDHASLHQAGVPVSMPFESRMAQRNQKIHSAKDTLAQSNNEATHALTFAKLGVAYVIEIAKGELGAGSESMTAVAPNETSSHLWELLALAGIAIGSIAMSRRYP